MNNEINTRERPMTALRKKEMLEQICAYVDGNLDSRITLQIVAEHFSVSVSTVTQLFQHRSATTFHGFLAQRRMAAAEKLIGEAVPLEEVGKRIGYTDHSSFYRAFKQYHGISPREYKLKKKA